MPIKDHIKNAILALKSNKMRAGLSSLGIVIGILSVIVLLAIGQGTQQSILSNIQALGTNLLAVTPGGTNQTNVRGGGGGLSSENVLTTLESDLIAKLPNVAAVSPEYNGRKQVIFGSQNMQASVYGVTPAYSSVRNSTVDYGSFIQDDQVSNVAKVAVLGSTTASTLFGKANPIGQDIRVGNTILTVIGVMKQKSTAGGNADSTVFVPLTTAQQRLFGTTYLSTIALTVATADAVDATKSVVEQALLSHFHITDTSKENFSIQSQADMLSTISSITGTMKIFLGAIAAISLIVGGIGVMNIMLVSVTERTREIGIRRAVGAQNKDIILQFLAESIVLCILGGIIGIVFSYLIIRSLQSVVKGIITVGSVGMSFGFALMVGVGFGLYPAYKAAKLKPIDALRYE